MQEPVYPMSYLRIKPIGVLQMLDQGEEDDKLVAVHADDPEFKGYNDISQLPQHRLTEISRFFEDYKKNENKVVVVNEMKDAQHAKDTIRKAMELYDAYYIPKEYSKFKKNASSASLAKDKASSPLKQDNTLLGPTPPQADA